VHVIAPSKVLNAALLESLRIVTATHKNEGKMK